MPDSNRAQLIAAAKLLHPVLSEVVFLGGSETGLLITDAATGDPDPLIYEFGRHRTITWTTREQIRTVEQWLAPLAQV